MSDRKELTNSEDELVNGGVYVKGNNVEVNNLVHKNTDSKTVNGLVHKSTDHVAVSDAALKTTKKKTNGSVTL